MQQISATCHAHLIFSINFSHCVWGDRTFWWQTAENRMGRVLWGGVGAAMSPARLAGLLVWKRMLSKVPLQNKSELSQQALPETTNKTAFPILPGQSAPLHYNSCHRAGFAIITNLICPVIKEFTVFCRLENWIFVFSQPRLTSVWVLQTGTPWLKAAVSFFSLK